MLKGSALLVLYAAVPGCGDDPDPGSAVAAPGASGVPDPEGWTVTRWRADPFALGSYSYLAVGATPADREALGAPVGDRLFFAGEATSVDYPSTVHGALLSGRAAANGVDAVAEPGATVLVIGAGMAGLGAAAALGDLGYEVTVLEGRDRLGGRTWTDNSLGTPLDLGASWIHGVDDNPVSALVADLGIETVGPTDFDNEPEYGPDGDELAAADAAEAAFDAVFEAAAIEAEQREADAPLGDALAAATADLELDEPVELALRHYVNTAVEHEYAASVDDLSLYWWDEGDGFGGGDFVFPDGYRQVVEGLADGLAIELEQVVRRVTVTDGGATVATDDRSFDADHVVVTLPLGVLKTGAVVFDPPLPDRKADAVDRIGMGLLDKTYLRFSDVFWDADADLIGWASPDSDGRWAEWVNMAKVTGEPILLGFNAANYAETIEAWDDEDIVADAMDVLRTIYGT